KRSKNKEFFMSVNLFGYGKVKGKKEHYIIEEEAKVVRKIFDYYTKDKIGTSEIGDLLNEQGYKTKKGRDGNGGNVIIILKSGKNKGQVIRNRYGKTDITGSNKRVINPKSEWIIHDDAIPAIVSKEQFDEATKIMESRTIHTAKRKNSNERQVRGTKVVKNIFYKKIWCGKCGADYVRETASKIRRGEKVTEYFYGCRHRRNTQRTAVKKCMNKGISHDVLVRELKTLANKKNLVDFDEYTLAMEGIARDNKVQQVDDLIKNSEQHKKRIDREIE